METERGLPLARARTLCRRRLVGWLEKMTDADADTDVDADADADLL